MAICPVCKMRMNVGEISKRKATISILIGAKRPSSKARSNIENKDIIWKVFGPICPVRKLGSIIGEISAIKAII